MGKLVPYNGHKSWDYWNISLWINNHEPLYKYCLATVKRYGKKRAVNIIKSDFTEYTPDGAKYTKAAIKAAISDM